LTSLLYCVDPITCSLGKMPYLSDDTLGLTECMDCSTGCTNCSLSNLADTQTESCSSCDTSQGYNLSSGSCSRPACTLATISTCCDSVPGTYPLYINSKVECLDCPPGCSSCTVANPRDLYNIDITCDTTTCKNGFTGNANNGKCERTCSTS